MPKKDQPGTPLTVSLLGATLPMPTWALSWVGALIILGLAAVIVRHLGIDTTEIFFSTTAKQQIALAEREYGRHMWEEPTQTYAAPDGVFTIKTFEDHCIAIHRKVGSTSITKLVPDLTMEAGAVARFEPGEVSGASTAAKVLDLFAPRVSAAGRCQTPHPGKFATWNGERQGCSVQIWRKWDDGCTHYQTMNTCNGSWETNPDGSPRVTWTACRH